LVTSHIGWSILPIVSSNTGNCSHGLWAVLSCNIDDGAQRRGYRFVITAKGKIVIASAIEICRRS
jgi:hypothetical protein